MARSFPRLAERDAHYFSTLALFWGQGYLRLQDASCKRSDVSNFVVMSQSPFRKKGLDGECKLANLPPATSEGHLS